MKSIHTIMLIDAEEYSGESHRLTLKSIRPSAQLQVYRDGLTAMEQLRSADQSRRPDFRIPDLILLDFATDRNGWLNFLDGLLKLDLFLSHPIRCFILSSSTDPVFLDKSLSHPACSGYISKPLDPVKFFDLLNSLEKEPSQAKTQKGSPL